VITLLKKLQDRWRERHSNHLACRFEAISKAIGDDECRAFDILSRDNSITEYTLYADLLRMQKAGLLEHRRVMDQNLDGVHLYRVKRAPHPEMETTQ
jgi:hypothetical protein